MHLREHQHEDRHIIAIRCVYFSWLSLCRRPQPPLANAVLSPNCDGKRSENALLLFCLRRRRQPGPLTSRGGGYWPTYARPVYWCSPVY